MSQEKSEISRLKDDILLMSRSTLALVSHLQVYRDSDFHDIVTLTSNKAPSEYKPLLTDLIINGKIVRKFMNASELRGRTIEKIKRIASAKPKLEWI